MNELNAVSTNSSDSTKNGGTSNSPDDMDSAAAASHAIKKRTKASRACDQCRKKKIKCDYKDEKGVCSNCQRNGDRCGFERVPLKRGPSKGYTRSTSHPRTNEIQDHNNARSYNTFDNGNNTNNSMSNSGNNAVNSNTVPSTPSRSNSVLLPPLTQYIPQAGGVPPGYSNSAIQPTIPAGNIGQQQFWKVPYHEFQHQRKGSIDSLQSDISVRTLNPNEQLSYNTVQQSPITNKTTNDSGNANGSIAGSGSASGSGGYWSFIRTSGLLAPTDDHNEEQTRRSSSIPSLLRNTSNSLLLGGQPQLPPPQQQSQAQAQQKLQQGQNLYSYSQFSQQQPYNPSISSFGQFAANGFHSRQGSVASEAMSPSAPAMFTSTSTNPVNVAQQTQRLQGQEVPQFSSDLDVNKRRQSAPVSVTISADRLNGNENNNGDISNHNGSNNSGSSKDPSQHSQESVTTPAALEASSPGSTPQRSTKKRRKSYVSKKAKPKRDSSISITSKDSSHPMTTIAYGQISDVDLIDTYYEFIHVGFPIIPLNKTTLTSDLLLVNTQPISNIHEVNSYVILWFRNSLELLVRVALKQKPGGKFFDNIVGMPMSPGNDNNKAGFTTAAARDDTEKTRRDSHNEVQDTLEVQSVFIAALNECFQKIVDIHPKFRENNDQISPKIKVIYLSTFILLNYILAFVGYDNSFVLGMSVTIFNEFKLYKLLLFPEPDINDATAPVDDEVNTRNENTKTSEFEIGSESAGHMNPSNSPNSMDENMSHYSVLFKRLYVLLSVFDSLQSCAFGGPKLLNISIQGSTERFFSNDLASKWCLEQSQLRLKSVLQSLKLGELMSELTRNRISMNAARKPGFDIAKSSSLLSEYVETQPISVAQLFCKLLIGKHNFINCLLSLYDSETEVYSELTLDLSSKIADSLCSLISIILQVLTLILRLNPTNSIDFNYRPPNPPTNDSTVQETPSAMSSSPVTGNVDAAPPSEGNPDFYKKLLGLKQDTGTILSDLCRGVISPFAIAILHEVYNITELVKQMPTSLISIMMTATTTQNTQDTKKSQDLVMKLSNSMNEVVQITSVLTMIKPFKIFEHELNKPIMSLTGGLSPATRNDVMWTRSGQSLRESSVMKALLEERRTLSTQPTTAPAAAVESRLENVALENFVSIGWKLLDDSELGWY
ncbi:Rgt1p [Saccharomyces paradoxus]|uniref:Rgt1p n=1 Tax=Saccharomyces paradoxus TaxID=27291 RepID=A0A8B8UV48_SACPA|nr:Rgt1 [Saccharomyces paradoxus]QHS74556.1 Rgt1 [Saccharomyces paradoxus]